MYGSQQPPRDSPSGDTAETLVLIGLIIQFIGVVVLFGLAAFLLIVPVIGGLLFVLAIFGLFWIALVYLFSYRRIREGEYEEARTPTLVFAILSLITVGLISGILYIVAYSKLGDAIRETHEAPPTYGGYGYAPPPARNAYAGSPGYGTPPPAPGAPPKFCGSCGGALSPGGQFCPHCAWPVR